VLPPGWRVGAYPNGRKCYLNPQGQKIPSLKEVIRQNETFYDELDTDKIEEAPGHVKSPTAEKKRKPIESSIGLAEQHASSSSLHADDQANRKKTKLVVTTSPDAAGEHERRESAAQQDGTTHTNGVNISVVPPPPPPREDAADPTLNIKVPKRRGRPPLSEKRALDENASPSISTAASNVPSSPRTTTAQNAATPCDDQASARDARAEKRRRRSSLLAPPAAAGGSGGGEPVSSRSANSSRISTNGSSMDGDEASSCSATGGSKRVTLKSKVEGLNEARKQTLTAHVMIEDISWIVEAKLGQSPYGSLCPQMRCVCGNKEYTCAAKLTEAEGEPVANKLVEAFSQLKDELCKKFAPQIEHSKTASSRKRKDRPEAQAVEHEYESNFLSSIVPLEPKRGPDPNEGSQDPPVPILHDKILHHVDYLSSQAIRHDRGNEPGITVINNGGFITKMSILDTILAVGTQEADLLLRVDETRPPGPNVIHFWCLKTMQRLFSLCHQGRAVRSLSFIPNSRTSKRAGLLCVLSVTGNLDIYVIPSNLRDGSHVTFGSFWTAPVDRGTIDGEPKGLLSYHVYVMSNTLWVLGGMKNGMINVWRIDDRQETMLMPNSGGTFGHPSRTFSITACCWLEAKSGASKEPILFATGDLNGVVCLWDRQETAPISQILVPGTGHCYIRELSWTHLDIASIYIRHQSVCVWNLNENSVHDIKSKQLIGQQDEITSGYTVDYDTHLSMGSITIWTHGAVMRGAGGCTVDGRELLQSWTFRHRQPMAKPSISADASLGLTQELGPVFARDGAPNETDASTVSTAVAVVSTAISKPDDQQILYRAFIRSVNLMAGLKDANLEYLRKMRFWEHNDGEEDKKEEGVVEIFGPGVNELVDPVPLTAITSVPGPLKIHRGVAQGRLLAVGSAAGLITVTRILPFQHT